VMAGYKFPVWTTDELVHVTSAATVVQVQPVPVAVPGVRPGGSISDTVTVPDVAAVPALLTVRVKVPVPPCATVAMDGVSRSDNKGAPGIVAVTVAVAGVGVGHCTGTAQPPLFAVSVFVNGEPVAEVTV